MYPTTAEEREYITRVSYASAVVIKCMQWCVQGPICHKLSQWLADTCTIPAGAIGRQ